MTDRIVTTRFAPSPTGSPHIGNLRTAIFNWLFARKMGGRFIARLEDTDRTPGRYQPMAIAELENAFRYLGIVPDAWWIGQKPNPDGINPYVQSTKLKIYLNYAQQMIENDSAYYCFCSKERLDAIRRQQQVDKQPPGYDRHCRDLHHDDVIARVRAGEKYVIRLKVPLHTEVRVGDEIRGESWHKGAEIDDQVLVKTDGYPTYFLASVVDDHEQEVTHIIRGDDWLSSTPKIMLLYDALGWEAPKFIHLPLIFGSDKAKLSKRHGSIGFDEFIREGYLPEALFNYLALQGWSPKTNQELFSVDELVQAFSIEGLSTSPTIFDYKKLRWMNGQYIRASDPGRIAGLCLPYLLEKGYIWRPIEGHPPEDNNELLTQAYRVAVIEQERMEVLSDIVKMSEMFFTALFYPRDYDLDALEKTHERYGQGDHWILLVGLIYEAFALLNEDEFDWTPDNIANLCKEAVEPLPICANMKWIVHPLRVAITGKLVGPPLWGTIWALGREECMARLLRLIEHEDFPPNPKAGKLWSDPLMTG